MFHERVPDVAEKWISKFIATRRCGVNPGSLGSVGLRSSGGKRARGDLTMESLLTEHLSLRPDNPPIYTSATM